MATIGSFLRGNWKAVEDIFRSIYADLVAIAAYASTFKTVVDATVTLANSIRTQIVATAILTKPGLKIGSTAQNVKNETFEFAIAGVRYVKDAVAAGTAPGNDVIPQSKYGAVAFDIAADLTIDAIEAAANATGYASAALAIAGIPAVAANHVRMGTVTVIKSDGTFTFGTTALSDASTTEVYTDATTAMEGIGAAVSSSAPSSISALNTTVL
jgi:hypothetical protein